MHSMNEISVEVDGEEHRAEFDGCGKLTWSDGDVWMFMCHSPTAAATGMMPCMTMPFMQCEPCEEPVRMPSQLPPQSAEKWEICWDWKKKGWCPRGAKCDWYHPEPDTPW